MGFWLLWALLASSGTSDAQIRWSPPGTVVVNVVNRDLSPVAGAAVSLLRAESPGGAPERSAVAGAGGHVEFRGLAPGAYLVRVVRSGSLEMSFGPFPVEDRTPPTTRIPEILAVLNPVLSFSP